jgi:periodic tryptophan protein 2
VTSLQFSKRGNVLFSASLDGSVRAWDLLRYRNFRVYTAAKRVQFTSLAVDPSGEIIAAGGLDDFDVHLWSVQTAQLLDRLSGHEGPIASLAFDSEGGQLASGSWDKTVRIWNVFGRSTQVEPLLQQSDVMAVAFRPDSKQVAVATLDGQLTIWDAELGKQVGTIDGRRDISGGRYATDRFTSESSQRSKHFTTISYNADGTTVLAGGNSKHICMYDIANEVLLRKFTISRNMDLDGTLDKLNSKNMTEAGPIDLIDVAGEDSDLENRIDRTLPGAQRGDASVRKVRPAVRTTGIQYSPTGRSFAAATTEGLLIYSVDELLNFDPFDLDIDITVSNTISCLKDRDYMVALVMAFRLGETSLIQRVYESIPVSDIDLIARDLPVVYLLRILRFITNYVEQSPHVEYNLLWIKGLITHHGRYILDNRHQYLSVLRGALKFVNRLNSDVNRVSASNHYTLEYLISANSEEMLLGPEDILSVIEHPDKSADAIDVDSDNDGWFGPESKTAAVSRSQLGDGIDNSDNDEMLE